MTTRIAFILIAVLSLAACETVEGMGQDMQTAGQTVQQEANKAQSDM